MPSKLKMTRRPEDFAVFRLLAHALSYRMPMQVTQIVVYSGTDAFPLCPRCDVSFEREYAGFCDRCGQRLGWDRYEEASVCYAPRRGRSRVIELSY